MTELNQNWLSPPGDTISDILKERGWPQIELATRLGLSLKHVNHLIHGKAPINEETALKLERVLGSNARFWLNRESQYREQLARIDDAKSFSPWHAWLKKLPLSELSSQGYIPKKRLSSKNIPSIMGDILVFFGVASPEDWSKQYEDKQFSFRQAQKKPDIGAISAWLRLGEIKAEKIEAPKYNKNIFLEKLNEMRKLTVLSPQEFEPRMKKLCLDAGVVLVLLPVIARAHVSGVACWLSPQKALIQLSLYGKSNDRFWFTFFHEAAHILLHAKEKEDVFLDDSAGTHLSSREKEADSWAAEFLIPAQRNSELPYLQNKELVKKFSAMIGLHPGVVVGRLQHEGLIPASWMNELKIKMACSPNIGG